MSNLDDDPDHPIPYVGNLDTVVETDRGAYFGMVIASPYVSDARSEARLRAKLRGYFRHIHEVRHDWNATHPEPMEVRLHIAVHHASDPQVLVILHEASRTAAEESIEFKLQSIDDDYNIHS